MTTNDEPAAPRKRDPIYEKIARQMREKDAEHDAEYAFKMGVLLIVGRLASLIAPEDPLIIRAITLIQQGDAAACEELAQGFAIVQMIAQASPEERAQIKKSAEATLAKQKTEPTL
jgi:hypothetical protein